MKKAVFAGSFDPPTNGHLDIIQRASKLFDQIDVVISVNPEKNYLFSQEERVDMMSALLKEYRNVSIHAFSGLIVNYAKSVNASFLIRGVRSANDFAYEFDLAQMKSQEKRAV